MLTVVRYLADASAITRLTHPDVAAELSPLIAAGQVATCGFIDMELYALVRDPVELAKVRANRALAFPWLAATDEDLRRALEIQQAALPEHTYHWPKLLVAAVAERHRVTLLHHDAIFDRIAEVTGQAAQWLGR